MVEKNNKNPGKPWLVGGFSPTHLKKMRMSNWDHFPRDRDENKKSLKPPGSW